MGDSVFLPFKKAPYFQPNWDMCATTAIKNVVDNQFGTSISLSDLNKFCRYSGKYQQGVAIEHLEQYLGKMVAKYGFEFHLEENMKIDDLLNLLQKGIYPIVLFPLSKYNRWKGKNDLREVVGDGEPNHHVLIVVSVDKDRGVIKVFDTIKNKFRNYQDLNTIYDDVNLVQFLECWLHTDLIYPAMWFTKAQKQKKLNKTNTRLTV